MEDNFSFRLKLAMNRKGIKPVQLASLTGLNKGIISKYTNGKYKPKQDRLHQLAKILDVNEGWLLGYDVPMERTEIDLTELDRIMLEKMKDLSDDDKYIVMSVVDSIKGKNK